MKKLISILLVCAILMSISACFRSPNSQGNTAVPGGTQQGQQKATNVPSQDQQNATNEPSQRPKSQADLDFEALDTEAFVSVVTSDGLTYHQFVIDPESFDIDESQVERGWGDISRTADAESYDENRELIKALAAIDREQLSDMNRIAYDNLLMCLELSNKGEEFYYYSEPLTTLNGEHTTLPLMLTLYDITDVGDVENYLYLLEDAPRYIGQIEQFEIEKADAGLFMTENALDQVLTSCRDFADEGEDCFLIGHLEDVLESKELGLTEEQKNAYLERSRNCVLNELIPAYDRLADTLESLRGSCSKFVGARERGEKTVEYYELGMQSRGGCELESGKISELLDKACRNTFTDMYSIILSDINVLTDYDKAVTSGNVDQDVDYLLGLISDVYPKIDEQWIDYVTVPESVAEDFSPAAYLISAYDDPSRNIVLLNPTSQDDNMLFTLAHECFPGHLYQTQYFRALDGLSLTQQVTAPSGYTEGWAVFSEFIIAGMADKYGTKACTVKQLESILGNILIPAYVSTQVNLEGWTKDDIDSYLSEFGLNSEDYIDVIYEYAVDMPLYFFDYALGYTYTSLIYDSAAPKTTAEMNAFFSKYLGCGPCRFDILFDEFNVEP